MNRETSLYLDLVRVSAALVVFFGHLSGQRLTGGVFWQFGQFMDDAVVVFFVLSGFVIAHVVSLREIDVHQYVIARAARMYSVALPALLTTFVLDAIGKYVSPNLYSASWGYIDVNGIWRILSGAFFLNQLWYFNISIGSMLPYWSLGFEVWYYLLFGVLYFSTPKLRWPLFITLSFLAGPRILFLFPLWLSGYFSYQLIVSKPPGKILSATFFYGSLIAYPFYCMYLKQEFLSANISPLFGDNPLTRYVVALVFTCNLIGFSGVAFHFSRPLTLFKTQIRWVAGATFTIYLFHLPVAQFLSAIIPWPPTAWQTRIVIMGGTLVAVFFIAALTERRKRVWSECIAVVYARAQTSLRNS